MSPLTWVFLSGCSAAMLVALLWGNDGKISGSALLTLSLLGTFLLSRFMTRDHLTETQFVLLTAAFDGFMLGMFYKIFRDGRRRQTHRWAGFATAAYAVSFLVIVAIAANARVIRESLELTIFLNCVFALALFAVIIGSIPKSRREAHDVLYVKKKRLKYDILRWLKYRVSIRNMRSRDPIDVELGQKLKALRKQRELTLEDVAAEFEISVSQLSRYESGISSVAASMLFHLARFYDVPVTALIDDKMFETALGMTPIRAT